MIVSLTLKQKLLNFLTIINLLMRQLMISLHKELNTNRSNQNTNNKLTNKKRYKH